jgi:hypothetical protein
LTLRVGLESDPTMQVYGYGNPVTALVEFKPNFYDLLLIDACMQEQNANGTYNLTHFTTADLSTDRKLIPSVVELGAMLTEQELRNEWNELQEIYKGDCFMISNITPQQLQRAFDSIGIGG